MDQAAGDDDLISAACSEVRKLQAEGKHTVQLSVFDEGYAVYVDQVYGPEAMRSIRLGSRAPASTVSTGKALLAWLPGEALDQALPLVKPFTPHTVVDRARIEAEIAETRARGFAINPGEFHEDMGGVAAPIFDRSGKVLGAIGFCVRRPRTIVSRKEGERLAELVVAGAARISKTLGFSGDRPA